MLPPMYELLNKLNEDYSKVSKHDDNMSNKLDEFIKNQEVSAANIYAETLYGNCLAELNS